MAATIIRPFAVILVRILQKRYKKYSGQCSSGKNTSRLILIQSILYYFKRQFSAWGYFHPSCIWTEKDERKFRKLFPEKDFKENTVVVWYNPEAVTYYHNKIFQLAKGKSTDYKKEIEKQLKDWKNWN